MSVARERGLPVLRRVVSGIAAVSVLLGVGAVGSATQAGAASGDVVVIGDQVSFLYGGGLSYPTGHKQYAPGPVAGPPTTTIDPVGHTVTLAVNDGGGAASITLAWPIRPGSWQLGLDWAEPEQRVSLTRGANGCTFTSGVLDVHLAEAAPDGRVGVLSADVTGSCAISGGPYHGAAVRIGDTDFTRAPSIPRAQPASISTGAVAGTIVRHQVTVTNTAGRPWAIDTVGTGSSNSWSPVFAVEAGSDTCTGTTLAPGQQCAVAVTATAPTAYLYEHLVVTGDGAAMLVVPVRLEGFRPVAPPTGASTLPGRLVTTVIWDATETVAQPRIGFRVYDTTGGRRTLVASAGKTETRTSVPGSGARTLALVAANGTFAESPDVVLGVPAVTSEVVGNDWYGASTAFPTDLVGAPPRPSPVARGDLDPSRTLWVTPAFSNVSVCRADTEVCTAVPGTATTSEATAPQDAVWLPGGSIAFIRGQPAELRALWVVRADGSGLRRVAAVPDRWHLAAAPSGSEVFLRNTLREGNVERVRLSDGAKTLVPGTSWVDDFSVSSRGVLIIERRRDMTSIEGPRVTTRMNLDGSGARTLALPAGDNRNVTFDPTGTRVAFSVYTGFMTSSVWVAKADGSSARPISGSVQANMVGLKWSVDNRATPSASLGGPTYSTRDVTLSVGAADADDPVGSLRRECRLDAVTAWSSCSATLALKGLSAGKHTAYARVTDPNGHQSPIATRSWIVDSSAPTAALSALSSVQVKSPITVGWTAADTGGSLLSTYDVRARTASAYGHVGTLQYPATWQRLKGRTLAVSIGRGYQYCFSVRARDVAGNTGLWSAERCTSMTLDDRSMTTSSGWTRGTSTAYAFLTYSRTNKSGAQLTRTGIQGRRIAVVATTCPTCGSLDVFHAGIRLGRVSLYSSTTRTRQVKWLPTQPVTRTGTVTLRSTSGRTVYVDGIAIGH